MSFSPAASHDISSPKAPPRYHRAMLVYHGYVLRDERGESGLADFLSFWFDRKDSALDAEEEFVGSMDILRGIEILRDKVVFESRSRYVRKGQARSVSVSFVKDVIENSILTISQFPESHQYWTSVLVSVHEIDSPHVSLEELSEAVLAFLKGISISAAPPSEEMAKIKEYVDQSIREVKEMVEETRIASASTSARTSPASRPVVPRQTWCACAEPQECLMQ